MVQLGVNIDHVASVRQARYRTGAGADESLLPEPDPVRAAHEAELGGADSITVHLREDRRHIQDRDVELLRSLSAIKINLEMAATDEMIAIARELKPHTSMLVPEGRDEVTTEGGLNVAGQSARLADVVSKLKDAGLLVSAFIDPEPGQIDAAAGAGFDVCEIHTGPYAHAFRACGGDFRRRGLIDELDRVRESGARIVSAGMRFNAGHALNYHNVLPIAGLPHISELHIGHAIVSRAVFVGLRGAVREMKDLLVRASLSAERNTARG